MENFGLLLICHALAAAAWLWWIVYYEVPLNARLIAENGSQDNLHGGFHRRRSIVRALVAGGLLLTVAGGDWALGLPWGLIARTSLALLVLLATIFIRTFNPLLSKARGLDPFYVSKAPGAALIPDRLLTQLGWSLKPFLAACLVAGIATYFLLLSLAIRN